MASLAVLNFCPKILAFLLALLIVGVCATCPRANAACGEVPAGQTFRIRLLQPISSYSTKQGSTVRGVLIEAPLCNGEALFPEGSIVEGHMKSVHKVGLGFRHEVASLDMEFDRVLPRTGSPIAIQARVQQVDDAREKISDGVIHGIRATNTPQDHLTSRLEYVAMWSPNTFWILPVYRIAVPFLPEPEIYFPAGTDVILQLVSPVSVSSVRASAVETLDFSASEQITLDAEAASVPDRTLTFDGHAADAVNLVFLGSEEQLSEAFDAAGWFGTDPMSGRTALHEIGAFLLVKNYPRGPMSTQLLDGSTQTLSLQKGLDSLAIRDHLRIWRTTQQWLGQPAWFAASTQDVTANLSFEKLRFIHHVDGNIDLEREKIVRDLSLAGCIAAVHNAARPAMPHSFENATDDEIHTDGDVSIVQLKHCDAAGLDGDRLEDEQADTHVASRPSSMFTRYIRTQVLSFRDVWRENAFYGAFDVSRAAVHAIRRRHARELTANRN